MVLVQKRRDLASLIVARLYRHGVPVAGVDRLRLGNPLAVKDLMAALRFAAQPLDDLNHLGPGRPPLLFKLLKASDGGLGGTGGIFKNPMTGASSHDRRCRTRGGGLQLGQDLGNDIPNCCFANLAHGNFSSNG